MSKLRPLRPSSPLRTSDTLGMLAEMAPRFNLDFDDAYQYVVAERYGLTIVSFNSDFDRTERGRKTPKDLLEG